MSVPDTSNLASASDVFAASFTLPQIRAIHKSLHGQVEEKSARLRHKVGSSYRDLLGTADTIVQMKHDADSVQHILGRMGSRTSAAAVKQKSFGLARYHQVSATTPTGCEAAETARARICDAARLAFSGVLRGSEAFGLSALGRGERLVLATKVLVLSRVLVGSFKPGPPMGAYARKAVAVAEKSLESSRAKMLRSIDKALEEVRDEAEQHVVLKTLAAYSLLTSFGAKDALQHLLHVRGAAMAVCFELTADTEKRELQPDDVVRALKLFTSTILHVQALVPQKLAIELQLLKRTRLLADADLRALEVLRLDAYEKWCGDQVQFYSPYIRHDDLDGPQASELLFHWVESRSKLLLSGLKKTLAPMTEFKAIMALRTEILQHWIRYGGRAKGLDTDDMLDQLRGVINTQLQTVLDTKVSKIHLVSSEVSATLESWVEGKTDAVVDLWSPNAFDMDMGHGSVSFITDVLAGMNGCNHAVSRAVSRYHTWSTVMSDVHEAVDFLRRQRWDNDYDEIEAEEVIEARQKFLSKDDPQALSDQLTAALHSEFDMLQIRLVQLWTSKKTSPNRGGIAAYFLRVIRGLRASLPELDSVAAFCLHIVPEMYEAVARDACMAPVDEFVLAALSRRTVAGRGLWNGEPALPTQPSPGVFRFLRGITASMAERGADLWSPTAVETVRGELARLLRESWEERLKGLEEEERERKRALEEKEEGKKKKKEDSLKEQEGEEKEKEEEEDKKDEGDEETKKENQEEPESLESPETQDLTLRHQQEKQDLLTQWLYDLFYLAAPLSGFSFSSGSNTRSPESPLKDLETTIANLSTLDAAAKQKLAKSAQDYWKRTHMLFGLL
ncbi:hypothetical protein TD95_002225 [Thielaviopsis punctulata]|uniref:Conserved oligomeric Golgi complex subunit 1 n=1 Tax=Thielaviopsis punctulata TaxID=72032 RepID=A0A0F4ZIA2_9PEZI|nr:hypothetical protein TD95_002225 [Thielaviopsis punctulata]